MKVTIDVPDDLASKLRKSAEHIGEVFDVRDLVRSAIQADANGWVVTQTLLGIWPIYQCDTICQMEKGSRLLCVVRDPDNHVVLWYERPDIPTGHKLVSRRFAFYGSKFAVSGKYVGTLMDRNQASMVIHVYDLGED